MGPYGSKMSKRYSYTLQFFIGTYPNFMTNKVIMGEYKVMDILAIRQKIKILWDLEILVTQDHMGLEIQNATHPTVFLYNLGETLW